MKWWQTLLATSPPWIAVTIVENCYDLKGGVTWWLAGVVSLAMLTGSFIQIFDDEQPSGEARK